MSELSTAPAHPVRAVGRLPLSRRLVLSWFAMIVLGVVAGLVWLWLAHPAQWEARQGGIVLTEAGSRGQFSVVVVYVVIGLVISTALGWAATLVLPELGWLLTPAVIVLATLTGLIAWRVGVELGPPPPGTVTGLSVGDKVPAELAVDGLAPFLVWPIFGLIGVVAATWASGRRSPVQSS